MSVKMSFLIILNLNICSTKARWAWNAATNQYLLFSQPNIFQELRTNSKNNRLEFHTTFLSALLFCMCLCVCICLCIHKSEILFKQKKKKSLENMVSRDLSTWICLPAGWQWFQDSWVLQPATLGSSCTHQPADTSWRHLRPHSQPCQELAHPSAAFTPSHDFHCQQADTSSGNFQPHSRPS